MKKINIAHPLAAARFDHWVRMLAQNRFRVDPQRIPQFLFNTLTSLLLFPFALLELIVVGPFVHFTKIRKAPLFVIGCWRSGTTYLQNVLVRDPQFAFPDPVDSGLYPVSFLLGWLFRPFMDRVLSGARPMDNLRYSVRSPIEETFALMTVSDISIIHMLSFPLNYRYYLYGALVDDLPPRKKEKWIRQYTRLIQKITLRKKGKTLLLKSPDNTGHVALTRSLYPKAKFLNIHREPYVMVQSTIHMFKKQMEIMQISPLPPDYGEELMEDVIIDLYARMYRDLFALEGTFAENCWCDVSYEDFCADPMAELKRIYVELNLNGFMDVRGEFAAYIESQKNYQKNRFELPDRLRKKINDKLGFYFEHYHYTMEP